MCYPSESPCKRAFSSLQQVRWSGPEGYFVSDEPRLLDVVRIHGWLSREAYWALGRPLEVVARSTEQSLALGLYSKEGQQAGFARFVTDRSTFAWLCDVFVDSAHRGRGLGSFLVETAVAHPDLTGCRLVLAAVPGRSLYARQGFSPLRSPDRWMERFPAEPSEEAGSAR
jgi:GNAT superfamily N-acetyltransferase